MPPEFTVIVPDPDETRMGPVETSIWDAYGEMHRQAVELIGPDMAFSILLSRAAREVRRRLGTEAAKAVSLRWPGPWMRPRSMTDEPPRMSTRFPFTCPLCGLVSHHPRDAQERFCGQCGFVDDVIAQRTLKERGDG